MIVAINYADSKFEAIRTYNTQTAYSKGKVDKVIEYSPSDIDKEFKYRYANIFSYERGAGLWLWKPYIILDALHRMNDGDYLFYCDSGAYYVNKIRYLVEVLNQHEQSIMPFEICVLERQFTKKETFVLMNHFNYTENQICTGYILLKKSNTSINFVQEWLAYMCDERICSPRHFCPHISEFENFVTHREDQSVFSILCRKNALTVFRDPSNYGDRPWMYARNGFDYVPKKYANSPYPRIIVSCRKENPQKYKIKEFIINLLWKVGIFNQRVCFWLHGIKRKSLNV